MPYTPRGLNQCHSVDDLRALAQRRLPRPIFDYMDGGAETESTLRRNTDAFDELRLIPRSLVNVAAVSTGTEILGQKISWPVFCSPTGASRLYHPHGELAVARAAAQSGTYYSLSVAGTHTIEQVAAESSGPKLFQVLIFKDRGLTRELMARCRAAGYEALCLTVDAALRGKRERELRSGIPLRPTLASKLRFLQRPGWCLGQMLQGALAMPNVAGNRGRDWSLGATAQYLSQQLDPTVSWAQVEDLIQQWSGAFAIKGILSIEDARRARDHGATALMVSNHGGRQLDGTVAPIEVLAEIVDAVGQQIEVILDGGIRRGSQVLKALAVGAKACSIGRPYLYGLAAGGEAGVTRALNLLKAELIGTMQLCGCTDVARIDSSIVRRMAFN